PCALCPNSASCGLYRLGPTYPPSCPAGVCHPGILPVPGHHLLAAAVSHVFCLGAVRQFPAAAAHRGAARGNTLHILGHWLVELGVVLLSRVVHVVLLAGRMRCRSAPADATASVAARGSAPGAGNVGELLDVLQRIFHRHRSGKLLRHLSESGAAAVAARCNADAPPSAALRDSGAADRDTARRLVGDAAFHRGRTEGRFLAAWCGAFFFL